jgi:hypothetical protein
VLCGPKHRRVCVIEKHGDGEGTGCDDEECECGVGVGVNSVVLCNTTGCRVHRTVIRFRQNPMNFCM